MSKYQQLQESLKQSQHTWLVTGVAGFIGSNLLETLLKLNQKVIGLDNFATGYQHNIDMALVDAGVDNSTELFRFIEGDIRNMDTCHKACAGVDYILHQAALGSVPRSIEDPVRTNQANVDGFLNMLVAGRNSGVKRFVYAASSSTYGDHPGLPKVEDKIGKPLSPYAVTKYVNELYADVFARNYGFTSIGLRYFNIFGQRQDPKGAYAAVIPLWFSGLINGEKIYINGDGETSRDFCFIDNCVQANLLAACAKNEDAINQVYNVAFGEQTTLNELFKLIKEKVINFYSYVQSAEPVYRDFRQGDVRHSLADISKANRLLGYEPGYSASDGLDIAGKWYMDNMERPLKNVQFCSSSRKAKILNKGIH